jgi:hypothetical protein
MARWLDGGRSGLDKTGEGGGWTGWGEKGVGRIDGSTGEEGFGWTG